MSPEQCCQLLLHLICHAKGEGEEFHPPSSVAFLAAFGSQHQWLRGVSPCLEVHKATPDT